MGFLYGRAGRLNTKNAGFRPGQQPARPAAAALMADVLRAGGPRGWVAAGGAALRGRAGGRMQTILTPLYWWISVRLLAFGSPVHDFRGAVLLLKYAGGHSEPPSPLNRHHRCQGIEMTSSQTPNPATSHRHPGRLRRRGRADRVRGAAVPWRPAARLTAARPLHCGGARHGVRCADGGRRRRPRPGRGPALARGQRAGRRAPRGRRPPRGRAALGLPRSAPAAGLRLPQLPVPAVRAAAARAALRRAARARGRPRDRAVGRAELCACASAGVSVCSGG
jgi:hypothetical protein